MAARANQSRGEGAERLVPTSSHPCPPSDSERPFDPETPACVQASTEGRPELSCAPSPGARRRHIRAGGRVRLSHYAGSDAPGSSPERRNGLEPGATPLFGSAIETLAER
jgi:hypothetical protein